MADYNFSCLVDKEFEALCIDLLSANFQQRIERFKPGKDKGIDGRFYTSPGTQTIIQCKHWLKSGFPALLRHLSSTEKPKITKLNPGHYILVTSLELSPYNKTQISNALAPHIKLESDIYGAEDLNILLQNHPAVEQRHYKLWINSTNVLQIILHSAIKGRSSFKLDEIQRKSKLFVETTGFAAARKKLEALHTVIISGEPGVGKTTLADQLTFLYASHGYELCYITNSLNEAEAVYDANQEQLFYFDDFLGRNYLEALQPHQDTQIINFIKRVTRDPKKRFILTSRSNILYTGFNLSDAFDHEKLVRNEYRIEIDDLSELDKARILYNHMWFSELSEEHLEKIYEKSRYILIIKHKNFNPRLISFITDAQRYDGVSPDRYCESILQTLKNPKDVWKNVFDIQLNAICKDIVVAVVLDGSDVPEEDIKAFYYKRKTHYQNNVDLPTLDATLRVLTGSLLNRIYLDWLQKTVYGLFNPSIADYVIVNFIEDEEYVASIINCLKRPTAIHSLVGIFNANKPQRHHIIGVATRLLDSALDNPPALDEFTVSLLLLRYKLAVSSAKYLDLDRALFSLICAQEVPDKLVSDVVKLTSLFVKAGVITTGDARLFSKIDNWLTAQKHDYGWEDYENLSMLVSAIEPQEGPKTALFRSSLLEYLGDAITDYITDEEVLPDTYDPAHYDAEQAEKFIRELLNDLAITFSSEDIAHIRNEIDISQVIETNLSRAESSYGNSIDGESPTRYDIGEIHDLFDRK